MTQAPARTDLPPDVAADRRERDALAADVATAVEADLFITERPYLFGTKRIHVPAVTLCQTPEALAMIGLYLRSQGEFILWRRLSAFTQFPRVPSLMPRSRATCAIGLPVSRTSWTAPSRKSASNFLRVSAIAVLLKAMCSRYEGETVNGNRILTPWRHLNLDPSIGWLVYSSGAWAGMRPRSRSLSL